MTAHGLTVYGCEPDEAALFGELGPHFGVELTITGTPASETSVVAASGHRCVSVGHKSALTGPVLRALRSAGVTYVSTRSIGFDHIDLDAAGALGITVENVAYAPDGVADFTVLLILMALRDVTAVVTAAEGHDFRLGPTRGRDLCDLTVGVVGFGNIGRAVARRLDGFGCRVLVCNDGRAGAPTRELVPLAHLLAASDVVTLHVPLTVATRHLIGRDELASMPAGAVLVNTGRGALVDTPALLAALERGWLGGAALDVLEGEEGIFYSDRTADPFDHPVLARLLELPNAIVTPHTAFYTQCTLRDTVEQTLVGCLRFERDQAA